MWAVPSVFWFISLVLNVGFSFSSCITSVSVKDLGCHMHWSCSAITTTTTFTIQSKIQGAVWQNVPHCVQITSNSCDLSQVFDEFDLYKFVRLQMNRGHGEINLTSPQICDPLKELNARFSPPLLTLLWREQQLWVEVIFPCAPHAVCQPMTDKDQDDDEGSTPTCCPVTDFQRLNTTVTLYNKKNEGDNQTHTEMVRWSPWKIPFGNFTPGQEYCAVASFAMSALSNPHCVHIPSLGKPNLFTLALYGVFIAFLLIVGLVLGHFWCWCTSTDDKLPKPLLYLLGQDQEGSTVEEPRQGHIDEEEFIDHLSIISLSNLLPSNPSSFNPHLQGQVTGYYTTSTLADQVNDDSNTNDYSGDVETDDVPDASSTPYPWPRWSSLSALKAGMVCLLGNFLPSEGLGIPLSSVRVAEEQIAKIEPDNF